MKCAQAMGPFREPLNRCAAKGFLPKMAAIVSRGARHPRAPRRPRRAERHRRCGLAFTLDVTDADAEAVAPDRRRVVLRGRRRRRRLARASCCASRPRPAGGTTWGRWRRCVDHAVASLGTAGAARRAQRACRHTDKAHNNDLPLCREIYARVQHKDRVLFVDDELSSQALRYLIGRCDVFVASRFHAMVSSLAMGVPTLVIGWSHKYREVLDMFGLAEWALRHEDVGRGRRPRAARRAGRAARSGPGPDRGGAAVRAGEGSRAGRRHPAGRTSLRLRPGWAPDRAL